MSEPKTYIVGGSWGNKIQWLEVDKGKVVGWKSCRPTKGDLLEAPMKSGKVGVFKFVEVKLCGDPRDMFFATVEGIGYKKSDALGEEEKVMFLQD